MTRPGALLAAAAMIVTTVTIIAGCSSSQRAAAPGMTFTWANTQEQLLKPTVEIDLGGRKDSVVLQEAGTPPAFLNRIEWLKGRSVPLGINVRAVRMGNDIRAVYFLPNGLIQSQFIRAGQIISDFRQDAASAIRCLITGAQEIERGDPRQPRRVSLAVARPARAGNGLGGMHTTYQIAPILTGPLAAAIANTKYKIKLDDLLLFTHALINAANEILEQELAVTLQPVEIKDAYPTDFNHNNFSGSPDGLAVEAARIATGAKGDLAHLLAAGSGSSGWAQIASACGTDWAKAATIGELQKKAGVVEVGPFLDTFVHEVGHQLGAHHSFNGKGRSEFNVGYEPGVGRTLMTHRVALRTFHAASLTQMFLYLDGQRCGASAVIPLPPALRAEPTVPHQVPIATAFALDSEPDATATCGRIDEFDAGAAEDSSPPFFDADTGCHFVRSFPDDPRRIAVAKLASQLPDKKMTLHFRALAWSGASGRRPLASSDITVDFVGTTPFTINALTPACNYATGTKVRVDWEAGGIITTPFKADKLTAEIVYEDPLVTTQVVARDLTAAANTATLDVPAATGVARIKLTPTTGAYFAVSNWFTILPASACATPTMAPRE